MKSTSKASEARVRLRQAARRHAEMIETLLNERGPLLKGAFQLRKTRCGKPNCKCAQGDLHATAALIVSEQGNRKVVYLRTTQRVDAQRRAARYQQFRKTRAELRKIHAELVAAADQLQAELVVSLEDDRHQKPKRRSSSASAAKRRR